MSQRSSYWWPALSPDRLKQLVLEGSTQKERDRLEKWFAGHVLRPIVLQPLPVWTEPIVTNSARGSTVRRRVIPR